MSHLSLVFYPDERLRVKCEPVAKFDSSLRELAREMIATMHDAEGIGLAGPQIGVLERIFVANVTGNPTDNLIFINPEIMRSEGTISSNEGCLSIPEYRDTLKRAEKIIVRAYSVEGEPFETEADDLLSRCIQHELDHLDGVLFIDRLSRLKQNLFKRWYKKHGPFGEEE